MKLSFDRVTSALALTFRNTLNKFIGEVEENFTETVASTKKAQDDAAEALSVVIETKAKADNVQEQVNTLVVQAGESSPQVLQALTNSEGVTFDTLKEALDDKDQKIKEKADRTYVDTKVSSVASGSPKGTYATLAALQTAFPEGNTNIYVITADGNWYYWSGSAWVSGGVYQSTSVGVKSITPRQTTFITTGKNIFNKSAAITSKYIKASGEITDDTNYNIYDYTPVSPNTAYVRNKNGTLVYFDANKNYISGVTEGTNLLTFTTPANCYYIRGAVLKADLNTLQIELGSTSTSYEAFKYKNTSEVKVGTDNLDKDVIETFDTIENDVVDIRTTIRDINSVSFATAKNKLKTVTLTTTDKFKILNSLNSFTKVKIKALGDVGTLKIAVKGKNQFNGQYDAGYLDATVTGETLKTSGTPTRTTKWFLVKEGTSLTLSGGANRSTWQFKAEGNVNYSVASGNTVKVPTGAKYARVYYANGVTTAIENTIQVEFNSVATGFEAFKNNELVISNLVNGDVIFQDNSLNWYQTRSGVTSTLDISGYLYLYETSVISVETSANVEVSLDSVDPIENADNIYGVRYALNDPSPLCERVYSSVGLKVDYMIGTSMINGLGNDFDKVYPYSEMKLCNIKTNEFGAKQIKYKGEAGFASDGTNGDVFVEVPKFYINEYVKGGYKYVLVTDRKIKNFILDPAFVDNGVELDKIYIGAYEANVVDSKLRSFSNVYPTTKIPLDQFDVYAKNQGSGYGEFDFKSMLMLRRLFLVEYATHDSSSILGGYSDILYWGNTKATATMANSNVIRISKSSSPRLPVGITVGISDSDLINNKVILSKVDIDSSTTEITFSGDPINITAGVTRIYGIPQKCGNSDSVSYHTGKPAGDHKRSPFKYRGVENWFSNTWTVIAGLYMKNLKYYFINDSSKYSSNFLNQYKMLPYVAPLQDQYPSSDLGFIREQGQDSFNMGMELPVKLLDGASETTFYCDSFYSYNELDTAYTPVYGGGWDHYNWSGMYAIRFWATPTDTSWLYGGRLIYRHK